MKNCRIVEFKYDNGDTEYKIENRVLRNNFFEKKYYEWVPFQYKINFKNLVIYNSGERGESIRLGWSHTTFNTLEQAEHALPQFEEAINELNKPEPKIISKTPIDTSFTSGLKEPSRLQTFLDILWNPIILFFIGMIVYGIVSLSF
jgi:hypothetical protein